VAGPAIRIRRCGSWVAPGAGVVGHARVCLGLNRDEHHRHGSTHSAALPGGPRTNRNARLSDCSPRPSVTRRVFDTPYTRHLRRPSRTRISGTGSWPDSRPSGLGTQDRPFARSLNAQFVPMVCTLKLGDPILRTLPGQRAVAPVVRPPCGLRVSHHFAGVETDRTAGAARCTTAALVDIKAGEHRSK